MDKQEKPNSIFNLNRSAWEHAQDEWRMPKPNMAQHKIPTYEYVIIAGQIWVKDAEDLTQCVVESDRFINWAITQQLPYANKGIDEFISSHPQWYFVQQVMLFAKTTPTANYY